MKVLMSLKSILSYLNPNTLESGIQIVISDAYHPQPPNTLLLLVQAFWTIW